jgi:hypothetical protein
MTYPANGCQRGVRVREVLAEHVDKILVLPTGRRLLIGALLDHLASRHYEWTELECEVYFEETIDPLRQAGPWSAPTAPPCWQGVQGPLFHLWVTRGKPARRELLALIVPDQRSIPMIASAAVCLDERPGPSFEVILSDLIVDSAYRPSLPETDPAIASLTVPAGDGWVARWWKLGTLHRWQYGWSRWK